MSTRYNVGDKVVVNKDIYRTESVSREKRLYASLGDSGSIIEVFRPQSTSAGTAAAAKAPYYAKVIMDNSTGIKTFRLTSLGKSDTGSR
jgi:hypothetical protein